ncbi:alkylation response protein AidB-like acyl-CoA dehydrogenase [Actinocorallia herbida]|uniref:Alkylation response protein AidB-like acyl-CoA dehydrogenase n=1 Tax=Actinocorallia herbida TaxID=58109 RepID=A0A3N1CQB5_9ACTN|nr:acyl-CoA dehydrogenase family protein [Actinocorallia herbida]ROO83492.1 alkylation response protein AidB-like acyl-CoA dehydrogenase [Actinocorallia herbida]
MDLTFTPAQEALRAEVREWLAANVPAEPLPSMDTAEGFARHREWERSLAAARLSVPTWPAEYGGRGAGLVEWLICEEEYWASGAPGRVSQNGIFLLAPTVLHWGTPEQKARFLPKMATAEEVWAQAWSEPESGSDLASLRATATPDGDGWRLSGQKTWSSRAVFADWGFGLFRSDPASERHHGLTYYLFPLDAPGITVRPIAQLDGETGFAEIFFDDVYVPASQVLGGVGKGWSVAMATTSSERGLTLRSPGRFMAVADRLLALAAESGDRTLQDAAVGAWSDADAYRLYTWAAVARLEEGIELGPASSLMKTFWSELDLKLHELALALRGPAAALADRWMDGFLFALAGPIYAGTNEIQRNIIAERVLGLPR